MLERVAQRGEPADRDCEGTAPVTDHESKTVMIRAERNDRIHIIETVDHFSSTDEIPKKGTVLRRKNTYYGPELLIHSKEKHQEFNFRLTAPGPDTYLYLWGAETDQDGFRTAWYKIAEVKATFTGDQPQYDICSECGEPIRTLEHERFAAFGNCPGLDV